MKQLAILISCVVFLSCGKSDSDPQPTRKITYRAACYNEAASAYISYYKDGKWEGSHEAFRDSFIYTFYIPDTLTLKTGYLLIAVTCGNNPKAQTNAAIYVNDTARDGGCGPGGCGASYPK